MTKLLWEPPFIQPHRLGEINKFGRMKARDNYVEHVFGVPVTLLKEEFGSPCFVTSETHFRNNLQNLKKAFERRYGDVIHGWSYKTNYISAMCNIAHQEGCYAEVVSAFEYEKARHLGVPGEKIIFNGPNKGKAILERAINDGAHIHLDHLDELNLVDEIASRLNKIVNVSLRLNFDTGYTEPWSRFGFNIESGQARQAARLLGASKNLNLTGLHSHIGTFILEPKAYVQQVKIMCKFMREIEAQDDIEIDTIDIGGGLPSKNALQSIYLPPEQVIPPLSEYADAICNTLIEETNYRSQLGRKKPTLIFESGRAAVDDTQALITSVVGTKRLPDGRRAAILDAGTNLLFTAYWYNHQVQMTRPADGPLADTALYGPLCMNIDVVRSSIQLPPLEYGDTLVINPVGAYNNTQWMQFIEYRPNVVLVHEDNTYSVIREREDLQVMCQQDRLPQHLVKSFIDAESEANAK